GSPVQNKRGKLHYRQEKVETLFRLVVIRNQKTNKEFWFLTNEFKLSAKEISDYYRKRWDIEVFFRFLKQELNLSHLVSMNKNGIEVMVYMTMIAAMLLLIYKKANNLGYKTAKRRIAMDLRYMITAILLILAGCDSGTVYKRSHMVGLSSDHDYSIVLFFYAYIFQIIYLSVAISPYQGSVSQFCDSLPVFDSLAPSQFPHLTVSSPGSLNQP